MGSPFDAAMRAADAVQNSIFGEPVEIRPRARTPRRGQAADTTREAKTVTGVFTLVAAEEPLEGARRGSDGRGTTTFAAHEAEVWLSREAVAALGFQPREGDAVILPDRSTEERWAVARTDLSDIGDVKLCLVRERDAVEFG